MNPIELIKSLEQKAGSGDKEAAEALFMIAIESAISIEAVVLKNPNLLIHATRASALFPALIAPNNSRDARHKKIINVCQLGKTSSMNIASTKAMQFDTPSKQFAAKLYQQINRARNGQVTNPQMPDEWIFLCQKLPPPSRLKFQEWSKVLKVILSTFNQLDCFPDDLQRTVRQPGKKDYQIIDDMKKAILQAFHTILPD